MKLQFIVVETGERWRRALLRMVLDPKSIAHNDYGSFHSPSDPGIHHTTISVPEDSNDESHGCDQAVSLRLVPDMTRDQRQPLLPLKGDAWNGGSKSHSPTIEYYDDAGALEHRKPVDHPSSHGGGGSIVQIDVPVPLRETPRFPKEKWKTFLAFLFVVFAFTCTLTALSLIHDRAPDRATYGPLPDVFLDTIPAMDWALSVSEILIMISTNTTILLLIFHKHKYIIMRRIFLIIGVLYILRAITMYVTVLPQSSTTYYCSPKSNHTTALVVATRVLTLFTGFGLSINGKHTYCGDFIFSGHTVMLCLCYMVIAEYSPKRLYPLHWLSFIVSSVGIVMVLLSHGHYTIDVLIAYYITTTLFWTYHTLANTSSLKQSGPSNYLARALWYPMFVYFEENVDGPVPRQYEWPLPWPRRWIAKHPNRNS